MTFLSLADLAKRTVLLSMTSVRAFKVASCECLRYIRPHDCKGRVLIICPQPLWLNLILVPEHPYTRRCPDTDLQHFSPIESLIFQLHIHSVDPRITCCELGPLAVANPYDPSFNFVYEGRYAL